MAYHLWSVLPSRVRVGQYLGLIGTYPKKWSVEVSHILLEKMGSSRIELHRTLGLLLEND